jgi:hypothetical protein
LCFYRNSSNPCPQNTIGVPGIKKIVKIGLFLEVVLMGGVDGRGGNRVGFDFDLGI